MFARAICTFVLTVSLLGVGPSAWADAPTPFYEPSYKVGSTYTEPASIVAIGNHDYLLIVETDTKEYLIVYAEAAKGVVKSTQLGHPVTVEAKVLSRQGYKTTVEILSVK